MSRSEAGEVGDSTALAWVESPLQLIGAAEWAAAHETDVPIAGRLTAQMSETADELVARGAAFAELAPYLGIPWQLLARHSHWIVGDGFSGQFRLAASVLRPERITFLDDGANTSAFADVLLGRRPFARPGVAERGLTTQLVPFALHRIHARARSGRVDFFTAFDLGEDRLAQLADRGMTVERHRFDWTRASAPAPSLSSTRLLLGSARPVDGRMSLDDYLRWVTDHAARGPIVYLPHRREPAAQLAAVRAIEGVTVSTVALPIELVLAGARQRLEILTLPSSITTTLPLVLEGTGSVIHSVETSEAPVIGRDR